ncbi:MAG TPA: MBL fold metallo-hydrolase, partial [Patescibacteria group bacterium]|nr:MBL fold metallo-hydrolase [Patescibacteria group bacterium]
MKLTFLGATGTVTGSKYLLESSGKRIMIDCGLFQGKKELRLRNWAELPVDPALIDAILLTHAHLDHCGYIPRLIKNGFKGPIYCSAATADLCGIILPDSGHIQEEDAAQANKHEWSKHKPALPLYTEQEAREALKQLMPIKFGKAYGIGDLSFTLSRAGHILGAAFIRIEDGDGTSILFSGDLGRPRDPVMKPPAQAQKADYIVVESTYGDRLHNTEDPSEDLERIITKTAARGGTLIIPAFAVGRAQAILYYLHLLRQEERIPDAIPIYLDSPMAIDATELLHRHMSDHRLPKDLCRAVCSVAEYTRTVEESKRLDDNHNNMPRIIISASGMATGGRVLHHLKHYIGDARNTILLAGFQAEGTRGDRLARGEKEIKIHGYMCPVKAQIVRMDSLSAHADYSEILDWLGHFRAPPRKVFVV